MPSGAHEYDPRHYTVLRATLPVFPRTLSSLTTARDTPGVAYSARTRSMKQSRTAEGGRDNELPRSGMSGTKAIAAPRSSYPFGGAPGAGRNVSVYMKSVLKEAEVPGRFPDCVPMPVCVS
jgi:hypothetical protein